MNRRTWIYAAVGAAAAVAALAWAFAPRPLAVETAQATIAPFEASIDEDAKTRLRERYVVSAPLAGRLDRITLREGDTVKAGDVLATLAPIASPLLDDRGLQDQRTRVEIALANVQRTQARIEQARVALQQARNEAARSEELAPQGFVSKTKLDNDRLAVQAAQKELDAAAQERHVADHQVQQARTALDAVERPAAAGRRAFELRAPVAGRILRVLQPSEGTVALGTPLLELGDLAQLEIVAELLTTDALQATPGRRVIIERWGGPGTLEGRVRLVEPGAFTKVSALGVEEQRVKVLIDITSPVDTWKALGDGYRVAVRIVTLAEDKALQVPASAVFPVAGAGVDDNGGGGPGAMAVFVIEQGRAKQKAVQLMARNGRVAWVRSGVAAGETVIVYPPAGVKEGVRVKGRG